jgi:hypothetical protein
MSSDTDKREAPAAEADKSAAEKTVKDLSAGIEKTRDNMSATISALEHRLSPAELGEQAKVQLDHIEARVRHVVKDGLDEAKGALDEKLAAAKGAVHEEIVVAQDAVKTQLHEAKDIVTKGLSDARTALKEDLHHAITTTKQSVRDATLGRVENAATQAGDFMNTTRDTLVDTIRQNPIPAALAGIGLAWLLMNRSSASKRESAQSGVNGRPEGGYGGSGWSQGSAQGLGANVSHALGGAQHAVGDAASAVSHRAGQAVHQIGDALGSAGSALTGAAHDAAGVASGAFGAGADAASHLVDAAGRVVHDATAATGHFAHDAAGAVGQFAHEAQHRAGDFAHGAAGQAKRFEQGVESTLQSNPLAIGAVALAVGAALGYSLPRTQKEDALMGQARDRLLGEATHFAHDAAQSLQHLAGDAADQAKHALAASMANK